MVATSTAYVTPHKAGPINECLMPLLFFAEWLYETIQSGKMSEQKILRMTSHPNTYTITKFLSEHLLMEHKGHVPVTIVRPSIISASRQFPFPGWIDSYAAFDGFIAAYGAGVLHVVNGNAKVLLDMVPVDSVANLLVNETLFTKRPSTESPILYAAATLKHGTEVGKALTQADEFFQRNPTNCTPKISYLGPRSIQYYFYDWLAQKVPMHVAKRYFGLRGQVKKRMKVEKGLHMICTLNCVFPYFTHHTFDFQPSVNMMGDNFDIDEYSEIVFGDIYKYLL